MSKILEVAEKEVNYAEYPPRSNNNKYGKWMGFNGYPWCAQFVSWCYFMAGFPLGTIDFRLGFASCQNGFKHFTQKGEITTQPKPGDIVLFDWYMNKRPYNTKHFTHTGLFVRHIDSLTFETIEGNTSTTNDSNGGTVMRRVRQYKHAVFVHPKVLDKNLVA